MVSDKQGGCQRPTVHYTLIVYTTSPETDHAAKIEETARASMAHSWTPIHTARSGSPLDGWRSRGVGAQIQSVERRDCRPARTFLLFRRVHQTGSRPVDVRKYRGSFNHRCLMADWTITTVCWPSTSPVPSPTRQRNSAHRRRPPISRWHAVLSAPDR